MFYIYKYIHVYVKAITTLNSQIQCMQPSLQTSSFLPEGRLFYNSLFHRRLFYNSLFHRRSIMHMQYRHKVRYLLYMCNRLNTPREIVKSVLLGRPICINAWKNETEKNQTKISATRTIHPFCSQGWPAERPWANNLSFVQPAGTCSCHRASRA